MITTPVSDNGYKPEKSISAISGLQQLVHRYFTFEQRISLFLIMIGLIVFLSGIYMFFADFSAYYNGVGVGLILTGWLTLQHGILMNFRCQSNYRAAGQVLAGKVIPFVALDFNLNNYRIQYFNKQRIRLSFVFVMLLVLLHGSGLFWKGCVHAALSVNIIHLLSNEFRSYRFEKYWKSIRREIDKYRIGRYIEDTPTGSEE